MRGRRTRSYAGACLWAALIGTGCAPSNEPSREAIAQLLRANASAIADGDSSAVRQHWSRWSRDRTGFWDMHATVGVRLPFSRYTRQIQQMTFEIKAIHRERDYVAADIEWIAREPSEREGDQSRYPLRFYIVAEGDRWVLINPIDLLPRKWETHETELFAFHCAPTIRIEDYAPAIREMEKELRSFAAVIGFTPTQRMDYYVARSQRECGRLMQQRPSNGYAALSAHLIVSLTADNTHEAIHLMSHLAGLNPSNAQACEALAVAFGGNTRTTAAYARQHACRCLDRGVLTPLNVLFTDREQFFRRNYTTYFEAGAFVRFLADEFGVDRFRRFLSEAAQTEDILVLLPAAYALDIAGLESRWHRWLPEFRPPEVGAAIPDSATEVFSLDDPVGDASGDGDYIVPRLGFDAREFDLIHFGVFRDRHQVYFRIGLAEMSALPSRSGTDELFLPGVVIAIQCGAGGRPRRHVCHGVAFASDGGYDLQVNLGPHVSLANGYGKVFWASANEIPRGGGLSGNMLEVALPISLVGSPSEEWQYFVGTGMTSDRMMDFLNAGLMPVQREPSVFIGGGNFDRGNPAFMDVLLAADSDQATLLDDYDPERGRLPVLPMVGGTR